MIRGCCRRIRFGTATDGKADYLNVRIYVADQATPEEIAAAANVAVRLTFEIQSMDLPIGFPLSAYDESDSSVAIVIGSAARPIRGQLQPIDRCRDWMDLAISWRFHLSTMRNNLREPLDPNWISGTVGMRTKHR